MYIALLTTRVLYAISKKRTPAREVLLFLVEAAGLDSRANYALGLPRSRTSTGSPLCAVSPSSPLLDKAKEDIPQGHIFFHLVEAAGLEPTVSSTRNWRDTTFATPRRVYLPEYYNTRNAVCQMVLEKNFILCVSCIFVPHGWCTWVQKRVECECFGGFCGCFLPFVAFWRLPAQARAFARGY